MGDCSKIEIKGARVNNLKNIDLEIPRNKFIVVTGVSGSGKSSLAFDLLYAEGQRRYMESLSSYSRQFLGQMKKPNCDYVKGIPPAIAIEQKVNTTNPRSTVGTSTEIYDYLSMLFARIGKVYSPVTNQIVKRDTVDDVLGVIASYEERTRFLVLSKIDIDGSYTVSDKLQLLRQQGYSRVLVDGEIENIDSVETGALKDNLYLVIDRSTVAYDSDAVSRYVDSVDTAFFEGHGKCRLLFYKGDEKTVHDFSTSFDSDGIKYEEPTDQLFNFNSPVGACPRCDGFGKVLGIDEHLVVPNTSLSIYDGAVACWRGEKMSEYKDMFIRSVSGMNFPIYSPYFSLTEKEKDFLWNSEYGIYSFFKMVESNQYKVQYRVMLSKYRGKTVCPECKGSRLREAALYVRVGGCRISELSDMPVSELKSFFDNIELSDTEKIIASRLLLEIKRRLRLMVDIGLGYLTLNRLSNSLSGGESQRINLIKSLGSSLVGSLYVLDEPSIGLHSKDTEKLVRILKQLRDIGNTVVVVEHDEDIIREADYIIDIGVNAGTEGGNVVYCGDINDIYEGSGSYTLKYLLGEEKIDYPKSRRRWNKYISINNARQNNLKGVSVKVPLNVLTVITGVSGSGKSTLINDVLYNAVRRFFDLPTEDIPGDFDSIDGDLNSICAVEYVDQNPIGKSTRSNPVTYVKAYDEIRKLFAEQAYAKQMGYPASFFSFNMPGGRCEECKGEGTVNIEMQFMADLVLECESCHGKRFKQDILEVRYKDKNISDILDMTVDEALRFFEENNQAKIVRKLKCLSDVGLGYVKLGQPSSTLSGGESQRVKLAYFLGMESSKPTLFIFDEPTTGLHFHDIRKLIDIFNVLIKKGHSIVIIEHNMEVIKNADYIIDLGPEGGVNGGEIVVAGTPEEIAACEKSYTGQYLKKYLK